MFANKIFCVKQDQIIIMKALQKSNFNNYAVKNINFYKVISYDWRCMNTVCAAVMWA